MKQEKRFYVVGKWAGEAWNVAEADGNKLDWKDCSTEFYDESDAEMVKKMAIAFFEDWLVRHVEEDEERYDYEVKICEIDEEDEEEEEPKVTSPLWKDYEGTAAYVLTSVEIGRLTDCDDIGQEIEEVDEEFRDREKAMDAIRGSCSNSSLFDYYLYKFVPSFVGTKYSPYRMIASRDNYDCDLPTPDYSTYAKK